MPRFTTVSSLPFPVPPPPPALPRVSGPKEARTHLGELIRGHRKRLGLTRDALSTRAGYSPSWISQIEMGDRAPGRDVLVKIAKALDLDHEDTIELTLAFIADRIITWS